jgi:hypothetical protein
MRDVELLYSLKAINSQQTTNFDGPYERFKVHGKPDECLACGSSSIWIIAYGHIDSSEPLPEGYMTGGCDHVYGIDPDWECKDCRAEFIDLTDPAEREVMAQVCL